MTLRLRFWLLAMDAAEPIGSEAFWLWCLRKASDATDWGDGAECGEDEPW